MSGNLRYDAEDLSGPAFGTPGTANFWNSNTGVTDNKNGQLLLPIGPPPVAP
jgi:hypothetical protein